MFNNSVSSIILAGLTFREVDGECSIIRNVVAFHCRKALMGVMSVNEIRMENIVLAESDKNMVLKTGQMHDLDNNGFL